MDSTIYVVREQWDKEDLEFFSDKINADGSLFCNPENKFHIGTQEERCIAAIRYFKERLNYIYTRKNIFFYLEKVAFSISLFRVELIEAVVNETIVVLADQNSPMPEEFQDGLYRTLKIRG